MSGGAGTGRPNGRPRTAVRLALAAWAAEWRSSARPGGLTVGELADTIPGMSGRSAADCRMVRHTVNSMVKAGELVRLGPAPGPHRRRPRCLYGPAAQPGADGAAGAVSPAWGAVQASAGLAAALAGLWSARR